MPGDLPAAVDVDHWRGIEGAFGVLGPASGGVDRLVLEEQDRVEPTIDHMLVRRAAGPTILVRDRVGSNPTCSTTTVASVTLIRRSYGRPAARPVDDMPSRRRGAH